MRTPKVRHGRRPVVRGVALVAVLLITAACGNRLSSEEIIAQNGGSATGLDDGGLATGTPGGVTSDTMAGGPATDVAGSPDGSAGGGTTTPEGGGAVASPGGVTPGAPAAPGAPGGPGPQVGTPGETGPIVLGLVGTLSGPTGALNVPMAQAVQVWADHLNQRGGLFGRKVQIVRVDDGGDPSRHVAALRDLVENRKVVAFVGNISQLAAASGRSYLEQVRVPVIGPACDVMAIEDSPMFFSQCPPFADLVENIFHAQAKFGKGKKLAVIFCNEAEPCRTGASLAQQRAPAAGLQIVYSAGVSLAQPDFTSECINARDRGADVLFMSTDPNGAVRLADACARQGYFPEVVAGPNTNGDARANRGLDKMLLSVPTLPFIGGLTPAGKEFEQAYTTATGQETSPYAMYGWVAGKLFEVAATNAAAASQSLSSKTLIAGLLAIKGDTLGGLTVPLSYAPEGGVRNPSCYWAVRSNERAWAPITGAEPICR